MSESFVCLSVALRCVCVCVCVCVRACVHACMRACMCVCHCIKGPCIDSVCQDIAVRVTMSGSIGFVCVIRRLVTNCLCHL